MRVQIEVTDDFAVRAAQATDCDSGSNDDEHDLLMELIEAIGHAQPEFRREYHEKLHEIDPGWNDLPADLV